MHSTFNGYDLRSRYDEFNRLYFDGKLPTVPVAFKQMSGMAGLVNFEYHRRAPGKPNGYVIQSSIRLYLSNTLDRSHDHLDSILLHEMIHVHFAAQNDWMEHHGINFEFMRRDLQKKTGKVIPRRDTVDGLSVSEAATRRFGVVLMIPKKGRVSYFMVRDDDAKNSAELRRYCEGRPERVECYTVCSPVWTKVSMQVKIPGRFIAPPHYHIEESELADLREKGRLLFST